MAEKLSIHFCKLKHHHHYIIIIIIIIGGLNTKKLLPDLHLSVSDEATFIQSPLS